MKRVVIVAPGFEHRAGMRQRAEQGLVQQLVAQAAVDGGGRPLQPDIRVAILEAGPLDAS
jgi:hypothetical protein